MGATVAIWCVINPDRTKMTTILYSHPVCLEHVNPPGHPERPERLSAIEQALEKPQFDALDRKQAQEADPELYKLAHPEAYVKRMRKLVPNDGLTRIDDSTSICPKSFDAIARAVGAATSAVDAVFSNEADNVFAAVRPPGHHAEKANAMGFCIVNSAAIAARYAQQNHGAERITIVDFDVHHGNGTQDIFYEDKSVLFASSHQMPLYPGTGAVNETGIGNIFNAPLSAGDGGEIFKVAWREKLLPAIDNFAPDLIIVSAGFDAHYRDPLGGLNLQAEDFDWITGKLMDLAQKHCQNRLISLLEGGYDLEGLAESAASHVERLLRG